MLFKYKGVFTFEMKLLKNKCATVEFLIGLFDFKSFFVVQALWAIRLLFRIEKGECWESGGIAEKTTKGEI